MEGKGLGEEIKDWQEKIIAEGRANLVQGMESKITGPPHVTPIPALWQRIEKRLAETLEAGLAKLGDRAGTPNEPGALLRVLLDLEVAALDIARDEMRRGGMIPNMTAGRVIWFDTAKAISGYLRERIGMPDGEPGGGA